MQVPTLPSAAAPLEELGAIMAQHNEEQEQKKVKSLVELRNHSGRSAVQRSQSTQARTPLPTLATDKRAPRRLRI
jgi:hypothetical protein